MRKMKSTERVIKRLLDFAISLVGLMILWPTLILIALVIRLRMGGPVLFHQMRCGQGGKVFNMFKFRTMHPGVPELRNGDGSTFIGRRDTRLTSEGRWLREFSLDELPQLINVVRGEMSLVGPRPIQPDQLCSLPPSEQTIYTAMRPGITSLAQVSGRNELSWERRRELEKLYVESFSLWLDLRILFLTVPTVLFRRGVYCPDDSAIEHAVADPG